MVEITFVKPTKALIQGIADNMRQFDIDEVKAAGHSSPLEAIEKGVEVSPCCSVAMYGDTPLCIFGMRKASLLGGAVVWMLGTDDISKHPREIMRYARVGMQEMFKEVTMLYNYVYYKNTVSIEWLKALGFTIEEPEEFGQRKELFHKFYKESNR